MRVIIVSSSVPHVDGGSRLIVQWTAEAMRAEGHEVEDYLVPFPSGPRPTLSALVGMRALPFAGSADRLVAIRWPAHVIRHENKATWFIHHYRQLFDLWDSPYRGDQPTAEGIAYRESLRRIDNLALRESADVFANSLIVRDRLREFNGLDVDPLFPPLGGDLSRFRNEGYGDYVFYPSRVTPIKRQLLAIEAMRFVTSPVRLVLAGRSDTPQYERLILDTIAQHGLADKVDLRLGWMPEDVKANLLARCLAVAYLPLDEDSYGYPSLEASHCSKAIVTLTDAGGVHEFVRDGQEGLVAEPEPRALAQAFDRLFEDRASAETWGAGSAGRRHELDIAWPHVVRRLLGVEA